MTTPALSIQGTVQWRRGTAAEWTAENPTLFEGEQGVELDTKKYKIGDGVTEWSALEYGGLVGPAGQSAYLPGQASIATIEFWVAADTFLDALTNVSNALEVAGTTATVNWPDGTVGVFTTDTVNTTFGAIDTFHATYLGAQYPGGTNRTATVATAPTRDSSGEPTAPYPTVTVV